jgi:hypothetical protein
MEFSENKQSFKFRDARQERIHRRLTLIGAGVPSYFKDICRLRDNIQPYESTTHLIGHLIREIEGSLRQVLSIFVESTDRPKKGGHEWEIRQILGGLDIPEDHPVAVLWLNHAPSLAHRRAHRDNLQPPRPMDGDFQIFLDEFERIFDFILETFESKYLSVHAALDRKLLIEIPTRDDAKWVKMTVPHNQAALGYFFSRLSNPKWLNPLHSEGLFDRPPDPVSDFEKGTVLYPPWPLSRYLVRMAAIDDPEIRRHVCDILLKLHTSNFIVHLDILEAACYLPSDSAARIAEKEMDWLVQQETLGHLIPEGLAKLTSYLAEAGQIQIALSISSYVLGLIPLPSSHELSPSEKFFGPTPKSRVDRWDYDRFLDACLDSLAIADWRGTLHLLCDLLNFYLRTKYPDAIDVGSSNSFIWQRDLESNDEGLPNRLVSSIRRVAEQTISSDSSNMSEVTELVEKYEWDIYERIVLHLLRIDPPQFLSAAKKRLLSKSHFDNNGLFHEYVLLLASYFNELNEDQQQTILGWIEASAPSADDVKRRRLDRHGITLTDEEADKYIRWTKLKWLEPLKDVLPRHLQELAGAWTQELGPLDHPTYLIGISQPQWTAEPPPTEHLSRFITTEQIVEYLQAPRDGDESSQDLGRELSQVVSANLNKFLPDAEQFKVLSPVLIRGYLSGVKSASSNIAEEGWFPLLRLIDWVLKQPNGELTKIENADDSIESEWASLRGVVSGLISSVLSAENPNIPFKLREQVWEILNALTRDANPTPEYEAKYGGPNMNPLTLSLNTIRGEAFHSLFRYLNWISHHTSFEAGLDVAPEVREVLEQHLSPAVDKSLAVRAVYGERLPHLIQIDSKWVEAWLDKIFPNDADLADQRKAAWETFINYTHPYNNVFDVLLNEYSNAIDRLEEGLLHQAENYKHHFVEHLIVFYARGKIELNEGSLLAKFYAAASDDLAAHVFWFIGRILKENDLPSEDLKRFISLVEHRVLSGNNGSEEMKSFGYLFVSEKLDPEWRLRRLRDALTISGSSEMDHLVTETLADLAPDFPELALECIGILVDREEHQWKLDYWSTSIRTAILWAEKAGAIDDSVTLINKLASRGLVSFRDLLP